MSDMIHAVDRGTYSWPLVPAIISSFNRALQMQMLDVICSSSKGHSSVIWALCLSHLPLQKSNQSLHPIRIPQSFWSFCCIWIFRFQRHGQGLRVIKKQVYRNEWVDGSKIVQISDSGLLILIVPSCFRLSWQHGQCSSSDWISDSCACSIDGNWLYCTNSLADEPSVSIWIGSYTFQN